MAPPVSFPGHMGMKPIAPLASFPGHMGMKPITPPASFPGHMGTKPIIPPASFPGHMGMKPITSNLTKTCLCLRAGGLLVVTAECYIDYWQLKPCRSPGFVA